MSPIERQFLQVLNSSLKGESLHEGISWKEIWKLAQRNHLESMVFRVAASEPDVPEALRAEMFLSNYKMIARDIRQSYWLEQLESGLRKNGIPYALLKGAILKNDYPETSMRYMADLDFYIRPEDRTRIRETVVAIGGRLHGIESGDEQFCFEDWVGVEFHGRLLYRKGPDGIENYPDWSLIEEERFCLTEEGYALNLLGGLDNS